MPGDYHKNPKNQWPKGFAPNPKGGSKKRTMLMQVRRMTLEQVAEIGTMVCEGSMKEMNAISRDPDAPVLKVWFATLIAASMRRGDVSVFAGLMERIIGKVADTPHTNAQEALASSTTREDDSL